MSGPGHCNACGKVFTREGNLTKHRRSHCVDVRRHSQKQWKHASVNLPKLSRTRKPRRPVVGSHPISISGADHIRANSGLPELMDMPLDDSRVNVNILDAMDQSAPLPDKRVRRPTWKLRELAADLPEGPGELQGQLNTGDMNTAGDVLPVLLGEDLASPDIDPGPLSITTVCTAINRFALVREYQQRPSAIPDLAISWKSLVLDLPPPAPKKHRKVSDIIYPYPNIGSFLYNLTWRRMCGVGLQLNREMMTSTLADIRFKTTDIQGVSFSQIEKQIEDDVQSPWGDNGWRRSNVIIEVPTGAKPTTASRHMEANARTRKQRHDIVDPHADPYPRHKISIPDVRTRSLVHSMVETVQEDMGAGELHWHGYKDIWQPPYPGSPAERVWGELYTSDAFLEAERDLIQSQTDTTYPSVIAGYMIWSDSTHLAQFGQAKAWPIYAYFGNQSKYTRCKPTAQASRVIAYIPSLPDSFAEQLQARGVSPNPALLAHCRRELFHGVWRVLLDTEFRNAYIHGVLVTCADGVTHRLFPRIFTYSADYPEKVLIATIRDMGLCPCPRCTIKKDDIYALGTTNDIESRHTKLRHDNDEFRALVEKARNNIYRKGFALHSKPGVECFLKGESLVPTLNAFSHCLKGLNFDVFHMLVVDVMHEFELGVWKCLLTHLVRILHALGAKYVQEFNHRFRQIASFGRSTIRRFTHNVADMKKLAARDFEDILQCCIPCFEGLLPAPHDGTISDLLYLTSYWHSLAKLRLHSETTTRVLENTTILFAKKLRYFAQVTCPAFKTVETDCEYNARRRATEVRVSRQHSEAAPSNVFGGKRPKTFNLTTYKLHSLGDYVAAIKTFGTTDSYSTQIGELEHRTIKRHYAHTNKRQFIDQMIHRDTLKIVHERMSNELALREADVAAAGTSGQDEGIHDVASQDTGQSGRANDSLELQYNIAHDQAHKIYLPGFLKEPRNANDPTYKGFMHGLLCHLLARHLGQVSISDEPNYSITELAIVNIQHHTIFAHATARFNYTTYDIRRDVDTINCRTTRRDVMLRACDDSQHPFWYARVIGIYHANVSFGRNSHTERDDFLFVRWFGHDPDWKGGPASLRLELIGWVPENDPSGAFGFINPASVVRACHLLPAFTHGTTTQLLRSSSTWDTPSGDWVNYYVSRFVDRDMMMRHLGWGIGHQNPPGFAHEADALIASNSDREFSRDEEKEAMRHTEIVEDVEVEDGVSDDNSSADGDLDEDAVIEDEFEY